MHSACSQADCTQQDHANWACSMLCRHADMGCPIYPCSKPTNPGAKCACACCSLNCQVPSCCVLTNLGLSVLPGSSAGAGHQAAVSRLVSDLQAGAARYAFWGHSLTVQLKDSRQAGKAVCPLFLALYTPGCIFCEGTHTRACNQLFWVAPTSAVLPGWTAGCVVEEDSCSSCPAISHLRGDQ